MIPYYSNITTRGAIDTIRGRIERWMEHGSLEQNLELREVNDLLKECNKRLEQLEDDDRARKLGNSK